MQRIIILLTLLLACGDEPRKVLLEQGRPAPVHCIKSGEGVQACTDGAGVAWICNTGGFTDADCVATGQVPAEAR